MTYESHVTLDGLAEYATTDEMTALTEKYGDSLERELLGCEARLLAYILPREPMNDEQIAAFCKAVYAQMLYENSKQNAQLADMPAGIASFSVNGFSASFGDKATSNTLRFGMCNTAWSELLLHGLLYRGLIR